MNNDSRKQLVGIVVGFLAVVIVGLFIYQWVSGQFSRRAGEIGRLRQDIQKFEREAASGRAASRKLAHYEERSLPANIEIARSRYQTWLVGEMEMAGLIEPDVRFTSAQGGEKDIFIRQAFSVEANGTLPQLVDLLYSFYRVDWLHRITQLKLRPIQDSKLLGISMHIETLSLKRAASVDKLDAERKTDDRLALGNRDAYYDSIVGRNVFGPRNNEPKLEVSGPLEVYLGRTAELTIKGNDPDPLDQVFMSLVKSAAQDARLDPVTGKLIWTPRAPGTYEFIVQGTDDGFPALQSKPEKFVLTVKEQRPPAPRGLEFDVAKFTILTAVLSVQGQGEVWLHVRPTGQIVTLREGDKFEIGSVKGTVAQIGERDFAFDFEGQRRRLAEGELLEQAKVISQTPKVAAPSQPATAQPATTQPAKAEIEITAHPDDKAS